MKKDTKKEPRVVRYKPLMQNIRVWFNYLQTAMEQKYVINKEYYRAWHLTQVRTLRFDKWYSSHKHLFANKNYVSVRVLDSLSVEDALKQVKKQLMSKVGKTVQFQITNKRFRYLEVDDYLKCWKLRKNKGLTYQEVGERIDRDYKKKEDRYRDKPNRYVKRKFTKKELDEYSNKNDGTTDEVLLQIVRRKVLNAETILKNTAKGQFTGKY